MIYSNFAEYLSRKQSSTVQTDASEVIEIDWDQIQAIEESTTGDAAAQHAELGQSWDIVDTTEATEEPASATKAAPAAIPVDMTALDKHAEVATVLYHTELR